MVFSQIRSLGSTAGCTHCGCSPNRAQVCSASFAELTPAARQLPLVSLDLRQTGDAVTLQATMQ